MIYINTVNSVAMRRAFRLLNNLDKITEWPGAHNNRGYELTFGPAGNGSPLFYSIIKQMQTWLYDCLISLTEKEHVRDGEYHLFLPFKEIELIPPLPDLITKEPDQFHLTKDGFKTNPANWDKGLGLL